LHRVYGDGDQLLQVSKKALITVLLRKPTTIEWVSGRTRNGVKERGQERVKSKRVRHCVTNLSCKSVSEEGREEFLGVG
jgi:hypothetical protein